MTKINSIKTRIHTNASRDRVIEVSVTRFVRNERGATCDHEQLNLVAALLDVGAFDPVTTPTIQGIKSPKAWSVVVSADQSDYRDTVLYLPVMCRDQAHLEAKVIRETILASIRIFDAQARETNAAIMERKCGVRL